VVVIGVGPGSPGSPGSPAPRRAHRPKPASVLILGSGPVVIGQAAEFDYAGTQACRALRAEGVRTVLVNSNPATIMTDPSVADVVYLEPLTVEAIEAVIARERPEGLLAGLGGQTALNLATALAEAGVLERHGVRLLGTPLEAIRMAEDREAFRDLLDRIGQPYAPSAIVEGPDEAARLVSAEAALAEIGLPAIIRPAFTLGGTGGGIVETVDAYRERVRSGLRASPIHQVMVEQCLVGWQEVEYEVMRDAEDTCIAVCSMENVDPLGVHTGDSIVVAPVQTLTDQVHQRLRSAALAIIRALGVEGGCNVQFALSPDSSEYAVIEVNPRVSRSSALASKATGYPIARVAAQIAAGRTLADIPNVVTGTTVAAFEPALDYVVVKLPRFPFDKFPTADRRLGSQMKATGEVMAIDRTFGAALNKALRGLEQAGAGPLAEDPTWQSTLGYLAAVYAGTDPDADEDGWGVAEDAVIRWVDAQGQACESTRFAQRSAAPLVLRRFVEPSDSRLWRVLGLLRRGVPQEAVRRATGISPWFLAEMGRNIQLEHDVRAMGARLADPDDPDAATLLATAKRAAFADRDLAGLAGVDEPSVRRTRRALGLAPGYAMVDTCAAEFAAETPYFYSTYASAGSPPEAPPVARPGALVIGSGPVRIGQGIEFDYCAVQAADVLRREGWSAVMVNSNPETVSTDFDASTRLYFEPLDPESVRGILEFEAVADANTPAAADDPPHIADARTVIADARTVIADAPTAATDARTVIADARTVIADAPTAATDARTVIAGDDALAARSLLPAVVAFGGQTPLNLAAPLVADGVSLLGSDLETIDQAEERTRFSALLDRLGIPQPEGGMAESIEEALTLAERIGYPVIVRPSFVIGGLAIDFAYSPEDLVRHLAAAAVVDPDRPVRIDRFLEGIEVDVDAVCDGTEVLIPGLLEHVERAGVHSGDSIAWFPPQNVGEGDRELIVATMERICIALGARGLVNAQFIVRDDGVYLIEVNPRASRTVPFLSKVTGVPMVELAVKISLGRSLPDLGWAGGLRPPPPFVAVKAPAFSTAKLKGVDPSVGPFMQSTGEVIGIAEDPRVAMAKALTGAALIPPRAGDGEPPLALLSIADRDKWGLTDLGRALARAGYRIAATAGTRVHLQRAGIEGVAPVAKLGAEPVGDEAGILELIASGQVRLVVNTPTPRSGPVRDAADIRHATIAEGILCFTSIETGVAAAEALDPDIVDGIAEVRAITDWVPARGPASSPLADPVPAVPGEVR
jgi:carbamoyl-phosphate synthase large subunit